MMAPGGIIPAPLPHAAASENGNFLREFWLSRSTDLGLMTAIVYLNLSVIVPDSSGRTPFTDRTGCSPHASSDGVDEQTEVVISL